MNQIKSKLKLLHKEISKINLKNLCFCTGAVIILALVFVFRVIPWYSVRADSTLVVSGANSRPDYQPSISKQVLRFHVLANSDSEEDQSLKLKVKQRVALYLQNLLQSAATKEDAEKIISSHTKIIAAISNEELKQNNCNDTVRVCLEHTHFPEKTYGDLTFPAGEYDALRILIGKGEGKNWWCVLFPSLCYVDEVSCIVPEDSKNKLRNSLSKEEYESLLKNKNTKVEYGFFLYDWIKSWF